MILTMKAVSILIGCGLILMMLGGMMAAIHAFRGADFTEPHIVGAGSATTNIVLAGDVMDASNTDVRISSTNVLDAPVPFAYDSTTRQLTVNGLDSGESRTLTITYPVLRVDGFTDTASRFFPAYLIIAILCLVGGAAYQAFRPHSD